MLTKEEKIYSLKLARKTLENHFLGKFETKKPPKTLKNLWEKRGVFVTLLKQGHLRGCIGVLEPIYPLYEAIQKMALSAAFEDPRFSPLEVNELPLLEIEISVLSPLKKGSVKEVKVGKHGIYLKKGIYRGVLLPQVPVEYNWDKKTFLEHVCMKAGLPPDCYKEADTELYLFTAEVFKESEYF